MVFSTIAGCAAVGGILFSGVYREQDRGAALLAEFRIEARDERAELRAELRAQQQTSAEARRALESRVVALEASIVEIETQFRAASTVDNMERMHREMELDLLQQCPTCKVPDRTYFPPGPGPNGNGKH